MASLRVLLGLGGLAALGFSVAPRPIPLPPPHEPVHISSQGRDREAIRLIQSAKHSILVRTECLSLVPVANELGLAQQRGVQVSVYLPIKDGLRDARLGAVLSSLGAVVQWKEDPTGTVHRGTYMEVDEERFLYSAVGLTRSDSEARVGYVTGWLPRSRERFFKH